MIEQWIAQALRKLTPIEMATIELVEAQRSQLEAESAVEYAQSVVTYNRARIARLRAYLAREQQATAPSVPEGWKLVPVVPTSEMIEAAVDHFFAEARPQHRVNSHHIYAAMLAAATQPKEKQ